MDISIACLSNRRRPLLVEEVAKQGFVFLSQYCPAAETVDVAESLGRPLTTSKLRPVQNLVPRATATPNTYSGMYGLGRFPFHTDLAHWHVPPRYLLLRCIKGYLEVPTLLLDRQAIFKAEMLDILKRGIFRPRRPQSGKFSLLRLVMPVDENDCFRWDEVYLTPASRLGKIAREFVLEQTAQCEPVSIPLVLTGDTLLIDNWRIMHARSAIPAERMDREIQRIYLEDLH